MATGDIAIPKCRSAIPPAKRLARRRAGCCCPLTTTRNWPICGDRTSSIPTDENQDNDPGTTSRERIHIDRATGGDRNHRDPCRVTATSARKGQGQSHRHQVHEQREADWLGAGALRAGHGRGTRCWPPFEPKYKDDKGVMRLNMWYRIIQPYIGKKAKDMGKGVFICPSSVKGEAMATGVTITLMQ